jgi:hypothetical protein
MALQKGSAENRTGLAGKLAEKLFEAVGEDYDVENSYESIDAQAEAIVEWLEESIIDLDAPRQIMIIEDEKSQGTGGGTPGIANNYNKRDLNTIRMNTIDGASLDNDEITLPIGRFLVRARAPYYRAADKRPVHFLVWGKSDVVTAETTISASTTDDSFNDSASGFSGLKAGDKIVVLGFTESDNNGIFTVVSMTGAKIVVEENLVTEVAGDNITIFAVVIRGPNGEVARPQQDLIKDGDMEHSDRSYWPDMTEVGTVTKDTGSPYEGAQNLKVMYLATANPGVTQNPETGFHGRFRIRGRVRAVGGCTAKVQIATTFSWSTTNASWTNLWATAWLDGDDINLFSDANSGGEGAEFDNIAVEDITAQEHAFLEGYIEVTGKTTYQLRHFLDNGVHGFGRGLNENGRPEIYAHVYIEKL